MRTPARALFSATLLLAAAAAAAATPAAATDVSPNNLGPHGSLVAGDARGCVACHAGDPTAAGSRERAYLVVPQGGHAPLGEPAARSCWLCHRPGNPYGARSLGERSLGVGSHGLLRGAAARPDSWAAGRELPEDRRGSKLPRAQTNILACSSCHDVHEYAAPNFLRLTKKSGDFTALCADCHPGRENRGLTGADNVFVLADAPYATHPTGPPGARSPKGATAVACGSCHDVHAAPRDGGDGNRDLLRLGAGEHAADLCRRCHPFPTNDPSQHPMGETGGRGAYPAAFASSDGIPPAWKARAHFDSGADGFVVGARQRPGCTSCHDLHGALPMSRLLYGPNVGEGGDWCFSCHPSGAVTPADHAARAPGAGGRACADCHGSQEPDGRRSWRAHSDFRRLHPAPAATEAPPAPSAEQRQRQAVVERLLLALRDERPYARENAVRGLVRLRPPEALRPALAALEDQRPDVQEKALQLLGAIGDQSAVTSLIALAGSPAADLRNAAARALGRIGGEQATLGLLPLLRDPAAAVRYSAVRGLAGVRDPRVYQPLFEALLDKDEAVRSEALEILSGIDDARILELLLRNAQRLAGPVPLLMKVIGRLTDPAGTPQLLEALRYDHRLVRIAAANTLRRYPGPGVAEALVAALESPDERLRGTIVETLAGLRDPRAVGALLAILTTPEETAPMRRRAIVALGRVATPEAMPALIDALGDPAPAVQLEASRVLVALTCRNFGQERERWREWWERQPPGFPFGRCR